MLVHADNRSVDHLDSGIVGGGELVYDAAPDTGSPPPNEAVVASGVRTKRLGQITPRSPGSQDPENPIEDTSVVHPGNATRLVGQHRLDGSPFIVRKFVAHDSSSQFRSLNHGCLAESNSLARSLYGANGLERTSTFRQRRLNPSKMTRMYGPAAFRKRDCAWIAEGADMYPACLIGSRAGAFMGIRSP